IHIDSGDESEGTSALKKVEERESAKSARRGPKNKNMQYFFDPVPVKDGSEKKWEFKCRTCSAIRRVPRTIG
ncbi:hypothetical protein HYPSUDRAFT_1095944, partial [Hypholoma sublateritium FD-334 SS-4]